LIEYVLRRMAEEGPLTDKQEREAFIDGNRLHEEGAAVVMTLGAGAKSRGPAAAKKAKMPITDHAKQDAGTGFVVGLGANTGERRVQSKRVPSTSPRTAPKRGRKSK
jgi:hypothetical protein